MALVAALKDASYTTGDIRKVGYPVTAGSEEAGWLLCDGRAVSRSIYATLFAKIGTTYGAGDGGTTFNLPDARGRSLIGTGQGSGLSARTLAQKGGAEVHTLAVGEMPSHSHGGQTGTGYTGTETVDHSHSGTTGGASNLSGWTDTQGSHSHSHDAVGSNQTRNLVITGSSAYSIVSHNATINAGGAHSHNVGMNDHSHNFGTGGRSAAHQHLAGPLSIGLDGGGGSHNNMPPFLAVSVLIKT